MPVNLTRKVHPAALKQAARDSGVVCLGLLALGVGFGVLVTSSGLPWWLAPLISVLVFAGSAEFVLAGMIATGTPVLAVALTIFVINSRHLFYGLVFPLHQVRGRLAKAYSVYALCDEAFALTASRAQDETTSAWIIWTQFGLHASWTLGALSGGLVGRSFLAGVKSLSFVLTALFIVLLLDAYRSQADLVTVGCAGAVTVAARLLIPGAALLVAMSALTLVLVSRSAHARSSPAARHA